MKRIFSIITVLIIVLSLASCGILGNDGSEADIGSAEPVTDDTISAREATGDFTITTQDGTFLNSGNTYTVTSAGTYVLSGCLEGQVTVEAGDDDEVILELSGVTITCGKDSPIKILNADKVEISAKKDTENVINDTRSAKTAENDEQGEGAIYAKCDLKLKGNGTLVVSAAYNNGVHTTEDLTIKNLALKVTAYNNALKGNDSINIESGNIAAISTNGDGVKTSATDTNKSGVTRGDINLLGGNITVYAAGDGIQASHDCNVSDSAEGVETNLIIYTGAYSGYTASDSTATSFKGIKVQNELNVSGGTVNIHSYDDGLHADYGASLDDGTKGKGNINISGGTLTVNVYAPENKTAGGRVGPGGRGTQQTVSGADGIHADAALNISGGTLNIDSAYEGLEANVINVSGGKSCVCANDDGVNACKGNSAAALNVSGGYLDVTVSPSGDTDGIDCNGSFNQTGGIVIARGPNSAMAAAIDADGSITISGGTLIVLGYGRISAKGNVKNISMSLHSSGSHTVTVDGVDYTFNNAYNYGCTACYSDVTVS